jgi:glucokinase
MQRFPIELAASLVSPETEAIGMGVAGLVEWPSGNLVWGPNVAGTDVAFRRLLSDEFSLPVAVDNDANTALLAEARVGAAREALHAVMITLGTGIGGALLVDGRIYRGRSFAGELGHTLLDPAGEACTCGQRGCWETKVSGRRLDDLAAEAAIIEPDGAVVRAAGGDPVGGAALAAAARDGDPLACKLIEDAGVWLGRGLANVIVTLDPEIVVIGGAAAGAGDALLDPARAALRSVLEGAAHRPPVLLVPAALGAQAGVIGAGILAWETL